MKKKFLLFLLLICFIFPFGFAFVACTPPGGDPAGDGGDDGNSAKTEFEEFSEMAVSIMANFDLSELGGADPEPEQPQGLELTSSQIVEKQNLVMAKSDLDNNFFEALKNLEQKEVEDNLNYYYADIVEQVFVTTLGCGDVLQNKYNVKNFYGVQAKMITESDMGTDYSSYMVEKVDNLVKLYIYTRLDYKNPNQPDEEIINHAIIDYKSANDFAIELITYSPQFENLNIAIVDSQYNVSIIGKNISYDYDGTSFKTYYDATASNGVLECFTTNNETFVSTWLNSYKEAYDAKLNFSNLTSKTKNTFENATHTVLMEEILEAFGGYIDMSQESALENISPYYINNGILNTFNMPDYIPASGDGSDVLPIGGKAMVSRMSIPQNVTKLIIPSNYEYLAKTDFEIVVNYYYMLYLNATNEVDRDYYKNLGNQKREEWVEKPINDVFLSLENIMELCNCSEDNAKKYLIECAKEFAIEKYIPDESNPGYGEYTQEGFTVEVSESSKLFKMGNDGNVYLTVAGEEILVFENNKTQVLIEAPETLEHGNGINFDDELSKFIDLILEQRNLTVSNSIYRRITEENKDFDVFANVKNMILNVTDHNSNLTGVFNQRENIFNLDSLTINLICQEGAKDETSFNFDLTGMKLGRIKKLAINSNSKAKIYLSNGDYQVFDNPITYDDIIIEKIELNENIEGFFTKGYLTLDMATFNVPQTLKYLNFNCESNAYYNHENDCWDFTPGKVKTAGNFTINIPKGVTFFANYSYGFETKSNYFYDYPILEKFILTAMPTMESGKTLTVNFSHTIKEIYQGFYQARENNFNLKDTDNNPLDFADEFIAYGIYTYCNDAFNKFNIGFDAFIMNEDQNGIIEDLRIEVASNESYIQNIDLVLSRIITLDNANKELYLDEDCSSKPYNGIYELETGENTFYVCISHVSDEPIVIPVTVYRKQSFTLTVSAGENGDFYRDDNPNFIVDGDLVWGVDEGDRVDLTEFVNWFYGNLYFNCAPGYYQNGFIDENGDVKQSFGELSCIVYDETDGKYYFVGEGNVEIKIDYMLLTYGIYFPQTWSSASEDEEIEVSYPEGHVTYTVESDPIDLTQIVATKVKNANDYEFAGWYVTEDFSGDPITTLDVSDPSKLDTHKLYAKFNLIPRNIKYYARISYEDIREINVDGLGLPLTIATLDNAYEYYYNTYYKNCAWPEVCGYEASGSFNSPSYDEATRTWGIMVIYETIRYNVIVVPVCSEDCESCEYAEVAEMNYPQSNGFSIESDDFIFSADFTNMFALHTAEFFLDEELTQKAEAKTDGSIWYLDESTGDWVLDIQELANAGKLGDVRVYAKLTENQMEVKVNFHHTSNISHSNPTSFIVKEVDYEKNNRSYSIAIEDAQVVREDKDNYYFGFWYENISTINDLAVDVEGETFGITEVTGTYFTKIGKTFDLYAYELVKINYDKNIAYDLSTDISAMANWLFVYIKNNQPMNCRYLDANYNLVAENSNVRLSNITIDSSKYDFTVGGGTNTTYRWYVLESESKKYYDQNNTIQEYMETETGFNSVTFIAEWSIGTYIVIYDYNPLEQTGDMGTVGEFGYLVNAEEFETFNIYEANPYIFIPSDPTYEEVGEYFYMSEEGVINRDSNDALPNAPYSEFKDQVIYFYRSTWPNTSICNTNNEWQVLLHVKNAEDIDFVNGGINEYSFFDQSINCATSMNFLIVEGGSEIKVNQNIDGVELSIAVYEYKNDDASHWSSEAGQQPEYAKSVVLKETTNYVIISVKIDSGSTLTGEQLTQLQNCIEVVAPEVQ